MERPNQAGSQPLQNLVAVQSGVERVRGLHQHFETQSLSMLDFLEARVLHGRAELTGQRQQRPCLIEQNRVIALQIVHHDEPAHRLA